MIFLDCGNIDRIAAEELRGGAHLLGGRWRISPVGRSGGSGGIRPVSETSPSGSPVVEMAPRRAVVS